MVTTCDESTSDRHMKYSCMPVGRRRSGRWFIVVIACDFWENLSGGNVLHVIPGLA